jgi:alpha-L-fucosidase
VYGKNQNYLTPENRVPEKTLPYPWESCIIAGGGWSYAFNAKYMSAHEVVHMLVDIVAKGGNLLLNIAPSPEGTWDDGAYKMLQGVGEWMKVNSHAIYDTRALEPYKSENICLTQNENSVFLIYLMEEDEALPEKIETEIYLPNKKARISVAGMDTRIRWSEKDGKLVINVPKGVIRNTKNTPAVVFQISK